MVEVNATFKSLELSYTSFQASRESQSLAVRANSSRLSSSLLNPQENQIVDDVGISSEAVQQFEEAKILADQLQNYLDYLNGRGGDDGVLRITENDNQPDVEIAGRSTNIAASIEIATYSEETLEVQASFDDSGNLQELSIDRTIVTAEYIRADFILEDRQFYAAIA